MASREEFLTQLWDQVINPPCKSIGSTTSSASEERPDSPFADLGPALQRLLAQGANRRDLSLIARHAAYEAVFGRLYSFSDLGIDED